jgi:hypothetical protein
LVVKEDIVVGLLHLEVKSEGLLEIYQPLHLQKEETVVEVEAVVEVVVVWVQRVQMVLYRVEGLEGRVCLIL